METPDWHTTGEGETERQVSLRKTLDFKAWTAIHARIQDGSE